MANTLGLLRVGVRHVVVRRTVACSVMSRATDSKHIIDNKEAPPLGRVYDKKPVKMLLEDGKLYSWCTCGASKKQPFCDNTHRQLNEAAQAAQPDASRPQFRSYKFQVDKKKDYFLCMCKQTLNRPFCDGTHKKKEIQDAVLPTTTP